MNARFFKDFKYTETLRYALFGAAFGATFPLVGTIMQIIFEGARITLPGLWQTQLDTPLLWVVDTAPLVLGTLSSYAGYKQDLLGNLNQELSQREAELKQSKETLEKRVQERTAELTLANEKTRRRARQFEAIAQVSRVINRTQNLQDALPQITQVVSEQFDYYHVGIFLLDPQGEYAVLSAANSEGGQRMLERNHKLRVGQVGIVGYVAESRKPRIALDTGMDAVYFNNPDLPETRSEMALPLVQGNRLIGVLDIQSVEPDAFDVEDVEILNVLAEQVTVAIANAQIYDETQKNLLEAEMLYRRDLLSSWRKFTRAQKITGIRRAGIQSHTYAQPLEIPGEDEALTKGAPHVSEDGQITIPIKLRGETVGALHIKSDKDRKWSEDELDVVSAIVERAALSIENARLISESRKSAEKERIVGAISARVSSFTNRDNILQAAVTEIGRSLPGVEVILQLRDNSQ